MGAIAPLVSDREFVLATRDTGYRSTAAAVAELIDNSLQAGAEVIEVYLAEDRTPEGREISVSVLDDGSGMSRERLQRALQFGGTERFGDRSGVGRFGMGLPNSSLSQAKRVDVYSWQYPDVCLRTYIDVDEIAHGALRGVPEPVRSSLPDWAMSRAGPTGTLVVWTNCDRLANKKASTVAAKLGQALGQIYRYFLWDGVEISINGIALRAVDPLFGRVDGHEAHAEVLPPLTFSVDVPSSPGIVSTITVRFSALPVEAWAGLSVEEKRALGVAGGAGVSVVRARREVAFGWYLMGAKRKENYDDWWRCEVVFDPILDEEFGVTHSKQGVTPTAGIGAVLGPTLEGVARDLNRSVRDRFLRLRQERAAPAVQVAANHERFLPSPLPPHGSPPRGAPDGYSLRADKLRTPDFYASEVIEGVLSVIVNQNHPFYESVYLPLSRPGMEQVRMGLECLLLASARADLELGTSATLRRRHSWSDALATFLGS